MKTTYLAMDFFLFLIVNVYVRVGLLTCARQERKTHSTCLSLLPVVSPLVPWVLVLVCLVLPSRPLLWHKRLLSLLHLLGSMASPSPFSSLFLALGGSLSSSFYINTLFPPSNHVHEDNNPHPTFHTYTHAYTHVTAPDTRVPSAVKTERRFPPCPPNSRVPHFLTHKKGLHTLSFDMLPP